MSSDPYYDRPDKIRDALFSAAVDMGIPGKDNEFGWGRIDLSILLDRKAPEMHISTLEVAFGRTTVGKETICQNRDREYWQQGVAYLEGGGV